MFSFDKRTALNLGSADCDHKVIVFANLGCPFCKKWFVHNWGAMVNDVKNHKACVYLKFLDKPKEGLRNGNIANSYIDYQNPKAALLYIKKVYAHQDKLDSLDHDQVDKFLETHFNVKPTVNPDDKAIIKTDAEENHVTSVPTVFIDGKRGDSNFNLPKF